MGFSMGGHIALRTALEDSVKQWMGDEKGFSAFATFYPVCKPFIKDLEKSNGKLTGAPICKRRSENRPRHAVRAGDAAEEK
jgi:dienelactone hydrolase